VGSIGLGNAISAGGWWIFPFRIYAALELNIDELDKIAKSNNTDINTLIKRIIDAIRARIPEDIPLAIIVKKPYHIEPVPAPTRPAPNSTVIVAAAAAAVSLTLLTLFIARRMRRTS